MIRRLGHLCLVTDHLQHMVDFYSKTLGLPVKFSFTNNDGEIFGHYLDCGDSSFIEIFDRVLKVKQWGGKLEELRYGTQQNHFCLEVTGLKELKVKLEGQGLKMSDIQQGLDHSFQSWANDPDGNPIEFMEYTARSLQIRR